MTGQIAKTSPRRKARIAGVLYLIVVAMGVVTVSINSAVILHGDAAGTATHILASELLYRLGIAADLTAGACYVGVTAIFYGLLKPVSPTLSLIAAFFSLVGCTIGAAVSVFLLAPLLLLSGAPYLTGFNLDQLQGLAYASLNLNEQGHDIGMIFFGVYCLLLGYLVFKSTFLPRFLGVLLALAGLGWLTGSFASLLAPTFASQLFPYIMASGLGEAALAVWLVAVGVNVAKWERQAGSVEALPSR